MVLMVEPDCVGWKGSESGSGSGGSSRSRGVTALYAVDSRSGVGILGRGDSGRRRMGVDERGGVPSVPFIDPLKRDLRDGVPVLSSWTGVVSGGDAFQDCDSVELDLFERVFLLPVISSDCDCERFVWPDVLRNVCTCVNAFILYTVQSCSGEQHTSIDGRLPPSFVLPPLLLGPPEPLPFDGATALLRFMWW